MTHDKRRGLVELATVDANELRAIALLAQVCNAADGTDLKLTPVTDRDDPRREVNNLLSYADGALAGYCSIDAGSTGVELCGMVHPAYRGRGIGRALLAGARAECRRRGASRTLLICEDASAAGLAFVAAAGGRRVFAEYHMELGTPHTQRTRPDQLTVEVATRHDGEVIAAITAAAFGDPVEHMRQRVAADLRDPTQRFYVGRLGGRPIASLKVDYGAKTGIYGFGVDPAYRGRGLGRETLARVIEALLAERRWPISLEVDTDNPNALALYRSCGFAIKTTYGYYELVG